MEHIIPIWAPNLHPLLVHFPIVLWLAAVASHALTLILPRREKLKYITAINYVLGAITAIVVYFSGRQAADTVNLPEAAIRVLDEHADLAGLTGLLFVVVALAYIIAWKKSYQQFRVVKYLLFIMSLASLISLVETAGHGAELVYRYGVGVVAEEKQSPSLLASDTNSVFRLTDDGSWSWHPGNGSKRIPTGLRQISVGGSYRNGEAGSNAGGFSFMADPGGAGFIEEGLISGLSAEIIVNIEKLDGQFRAIHHYQDQSTYDYFGFNQELAILGRVQNGKDKIIETAPISLYQNGNSTLRVIAEGSHFRAYVNGNLLVHGHATPLPPGKTGFIIIGSGFVDLVSIDVKTLPAH